MSCFCSYPCACTSPAMRFCMRHEACVMVRMSFQLLATSVSNQFQPDQCQNKANLHPKLSTASLSSSSSSPRPFTYTDIFSITSFSCTALTPVLVPRRRCVRAWFLHHSFPSSSSSTWRFFSTALFQHGSFSTRHRFEVRRLDSVYQKGIEIPFQGLLTIGGDIL